ncbi:MAG: hypothetical protein ABGX26_02105 [Nautiliaceae bacterium]
MKKLIIFLAVLLFAYDAKVEVFDTYKIKAPVAGEVVFSNKKLEAKEVNSTIVKLDDTQNLIDLKNLQNQEKLLRLQIENQKKVVDKKRSVYEKYKNLKTKSQSEKDLKFYDYIGAYNQLLSLKSSLFNTIANIKKLKDTINKKRIKATGYVGKIYVNKGDYVAPGVLIADVYDISKEKLTIYVPVGEKIKPNVYINGKPSNFKIYKVWRVPDSKYVTSYKVELVGKGLKIGEIVKIELK